MDKNTSGNADEKRERVKIGDVRREMLTAAALDCIVEKGYHNVRLEDVSEAAGLSKGSAFYYFRKKDDLLISVLQKMWDDLMEVCKKVLGVSEEELNDIQEILGRIKMTYANPVLDLNELLEESLQVIFIWLSNNAYTMRVVLEFWCEIRRNSMVADLTKSMQYLIRKSTEIYIAEGIYRGVFREVDPEITADVLISSLHGIAFCEVVSVGSTDLSRLQRETLELFRRHLVKDPS